MKRKRRSDEVLAPGAHILRLPTKPTSEKELILKTLNSFRWRGFEGDIKPRIPIASTVFEHSRGLQSFKGSEKLEDTLISSLRTSYPRASIENIIKLAGRTQIGEIEGPQITHIFKQELPFGRITYIWRFPLSWELKYDLPKMQNTLSAVYEVLLSWWFVQQRQRVLRKELPDRSIVFSLGALLSLVYGEKVIANKKAYSNLRHALYSMRSLNYHRITSWPPEGGGKKRVIERAWGSLLSSLTENYLGQKGIWRAIIDERYTLPLETFNLRTPLLKQWKLLPLQEFRKKFEIGVLGGSIYSYTLKEEPARILKLTPTERQIHNLRHLFSFQRGARPEVKIRAFLSEYMLLPAGVIERRIKKGAVRQWLKKSFKGYSEKMGTPAEIEFLPGSFLKFYFGEEQCEELKQMEG